MNKSKFSLDCVAWNAAQVKFRVLNPIGLQCGTIKVRTEDVRFFLEKMWKGYVYWNELVPLDYLVRK